MEDAHIITDDPITRTTIQMMTPEQFDDWLDRLRTQRLEPMKALVRGASDRDNEKTPEQIREAYKKQQKKATSAMEKAEKALDAAAAAVNQLRVLALEVE